MKPTRWHELEFRHLEYAIAVKNHQGFLKAAVALGLDQGFLSKQIRRLESRLGFDLFDRTTKPLGLTGAGLIFLEEAKQILARTQRTVEFAHEIQSGRWGKLDIGINTSIANSKLPAILQAFHGQFSNVNLVLHELASYEQIKQLKDHQIDVGFFHKHNLRSLTQEDMEAFEVMPMLTEKLVVVLPENHRFAKQSKISLKKLSGERFVLPPSTLMYGLREQIDQLLIGTHCKPLNVQEAAWITTVLSLVSGGMRVSLLPENVKNLQRTGVIYCDIQEASPVLEIVAVYRGTNTLAILKNFLKVIQSLSVSQGYSDFSAT